MNKLLLTGFCLFFIISLTAAQKKSGKIIRENQNLSNRDWLFKAGNNPAWADSALDTRTWQTRHISDETTPGDSLWTEKQGWFRRIIRPKSSLVGEPAYLLIKQFGATKIYMNGKQLAVLTPPAFGSGGSQRLIQFVPVRFADTSRQVLAIHYRLQTQPVFYAATTVEPVDISIITAADAGLSLADTNRWTGSMDAWFAGVFGLLALLHLLFYRVNPTGRINRTLAWGMLAFCLYFLSNELSEYTRTIPERSLVLFFSDLTFRVGFLVFLTALYQYLKFRPNWLYYFIASLLVLDQFYRLFLGPIPSDYAWIPFITAIAAYVRVSWLGRKTGDSDALLPWNSLKTAIYCFLLALISGIAGGILESILNIDITVFLLIAAVLFIAIGLFSIPVGLSLSLVRDYAQTHRALGNKLREVEQLSAQTLAQEQEKQQLLARQNELLEEQVQERTTELNQSLHELRSTQAQLVQREKLASLGELTAGIAHEIQNPLNFVNNFAEVSVELVSELREERQKPDNQRDTELEMELLDDLGQNTQKISEHGKRAASIVRGMLQHSRTSSGQKQATDINALVDEYMRLAYHGLRATDKSFNALLNTDFAPNLPQIQVVPEDIGRVLVNLFNNAFYAVKQKSTSMPDFVPIVSARTVLDNQQLVIQLKDNGSGIPDAVRHKVFQPFFTTKPTGQGTGLGLSISYDIITKGHGGSLNVETEPGEFTQFTIKLPISLARRLINIFQKIIISTCLLNSVQYICAVN